MKRLIGLLLTLSMLLTLALPAAAEEITPCDTAGCTLALGHEGDHVFPETCQRDPNCTKGYDHEGDCSTAVPQEDLPCDAPGCTGLLGHEGDHTYPDHCEKTVDCILGYAHEGDCQAAQPLPCDTAGCTLTLGHAGEHLFPDQCQKDAACTFGYGHEGDCSTAAAARVEGIPDGFCMAIPNGPDLDIIEWPLQMIVGDSMNIMLFYNGVALTTTDDLTVSDGLGMEYDEKTFRFPPKVPGEHTITYTAPDQSTHQKVIIGLPNTIDETAFCHADKNGTGFVPRAGQPLRIPFGRFGSTYLFCEGKMLTWADQSRMTVSPAGLEWGRNSDGTWWFRSDVVETYTLTYTPEGGQAQTMTIEFFDGSVIDCKDFCFAIPGNMGALIAQTDPLGLRVNQKSPFTFLYFDGRKITDASALTFSDGLNKEVNSEQCYRFSADAPGDYTITYTPNAGETYTLVVHCFDPNVIDEKAFCFAVDCGDRMDIIKDRLRIGFGQGGPWVYLYYDGTKIMDQTALKFSEGLEYQYDQADGSYLFAPEAPGEYTVTYKVQGVEHTLSLECSMEGALYAQFVDDPTGTYYGGNTPLPLTEDQTKVVKFFIKNAQGEYQQVLGYVGGTGPEIVVDNRFDGTYAITVSKYQDFFSYGAIYSPSRFENFFLGIQWQEATRLVLRRDRDGNNLFNFTGAVGDQVTVYPFFGLPSQGMTPYNGELTVSEGIKLTPGENGAYTLEILEMGEHGISAQVNGETYFYQVVGVPKASGGSLFALEPNSGDPLFFSAISPMNPVTVRFCYGTYGDYRVLTAEELGLDGGPMMPANPDGSFTFRFDHPGQMEVKFTDENSAVHSYVIKAYENDDELFMNRYWAQQSVTVPGGAHGIRVGFARLWNDVVALDQGYGIREEDGDVDMLLGALYVDEYGAPVKMVEPEFYDRISDVSFTILSYLEGEGRCSLSGVKDFTWQNVTMPSVSIHVEEPKDFAARVLLSFCIDGVRYSRESVISFEENRETVIDVNITEAKVLNTLLSNPDVLLNWMADMGQPFQGGAVVLQLPACEYEDVIVPQVYISGDHNSYCPLIIRGAGMDQTIMPGLLSKGGTLSVSGIGFRAKNNVKLPCDGERETCGILVDAYSLYQPTFDAQILSKYHPDYQGKPVKEIQEILDNDGYQPGLPDGNMYCMDLVENCSFDGFQYAVFSGKGGMAAPVQNCVIQNCQYGVYINCANVATHYNAGTKVYTGNTFLKTWCAVRIADLPNDLSPYYIRFQDNMFLGSHLDFWVTEPGTYYCYRNYFDDNTNNDPRGAHIDNEAGAIVVSNPCRIDPKDGVNLWVFDDDDKQNTWILRKEADSLLVNPKAMGDLDGKLEIPVLDDKQNTIGTWIVEGGDAK